MATKTVKKAAKKVDLTYITPDNWHLHKLSDLLESVVEDVKAVVKAGFKINMDTWIDKADIHWENGEIKTIQSNKDCAVCLGGSVLMGFCEPPPSYECLVIDHSGYEDRIDLRATKLAIFGDQKSVNKAQKFADLMGTYRGYGGEAQDGNVFADRAGKALGLNGGQKAAIEGIINNVQTKEYEGQLDTSEINQLINDTKKVIKLLRDINM